MSALSFGQKYCGWKESFSGKSEAPAQYLFQRIHVDTTGKIKLPGGKEIVVMVIVDAFSRFIVCLYVLSSANVYDSKQTRIM